MIHQELLCEGSGRLSNRNGTKRKLLGPLVRLAAVQPSSGVNGETLNRPQRKYVLFGRVV